MKKMLPAIALCILNASCNQNSSSSKYAKEVWADSEITIQVKKAILTDSSLTPGNRFVSVTTDHGVVTITGDVSNISQMNQIVKKAEGVSGVQKVENQMSLSK